MFLRTLALIAALAWGAPALSATYYVAPIGTTVAGTPDGTSLKPFASVQAAIDTGTIRGGDAILMMDGNHGPMTIKNAAFDARVTIRAEHPHKAHVDSIMLREYVKNLYIGGLNVWPSNPYVHDGEYIFTWDTSSLITFNNLDVRGGKDAAAYNKWTMAEWTRRSTDGAYVMGTQSVVQNSTFLGVHFGITLTGADSKAVNNTVTGFSGDGIRGNGDRNTIIGNTIKNCIAIDENHADGIQAFTTPDDPITGLTIENNTILEWVDPIISPLRCNMQGIGLFDGFYDNLTIKNNLLSVTFYQGIGVCGVRTGVIKNNTVVAADGKPNKYPWIGVFDHKNGTPSTNVVVSDNLAMAVIADSGSGDTGVTLTNNKLIGDPATMFQSLTDFKYVPKISSAVGVIK